MSATLSELVDSLERMDDDHAIRLEIAHAIRAGAALDCIVNLLSWLNADPRNDEPDRCILDALNTHPGFVDVIRAKSDWRDMQPLGEVIHTYRIYARMGDIMTNFGPLIQEHMQYYRVNNQLERFYELTSARDAGTAAIVLANFDITLRVGVYHLWQVAPEWIGPLQTAATRKRLDVGEGQDVWWSTDSHMTHELVLLIAVRLLDERDRLHTFKNAADASGVRRFFEYVDWRFLEFQRAKEFDAAHCKLFSGSGIFDWRTETNEALLELRQTLARVPIPSAYATHKINFLFERCRDDRRTIHSTLWHNMGMTVLMLQYAVLNALGQILPPYVVLELVRFMDPIAYTVFREDQLIACINKYAASASAQPVTQPAKRR